MGPVSGSFSAIRGKLYTNTVSTCCVLLICFSIGVVEHGHEDPLHLVRALLCRRARYLRDLRGLGRHDRVHPGGHGGALSFPAHPQVALGRVQLKVLQGRGSPLRPLQLQELPEGGRGQ